MSTEIIKNNAAALNKEFKWLLKVIDVRIRLHFGNECEYTGIDEVLLPEHDEESSYGKFIKQNEFGVPERLIFILSLAPHIKPQLLDIFMVINQSTGLRFTEFGGRKDSLNGFIPTGETALFLLAGDDIETRFNYYYLFEPGHVFARNNIISLVSQNNHGSFFIGFLDVLPEIIEYITTGVERKFIFGHKFPAQKIITGLEWEDLVLDSQTLSEVQEIKTWIEHGKNLFYSNPALKARIKRGYRSFFYGPPGTGKKLTAALLGKVTGREVFQVNFPILLSELNREFEKNLENIFGRAEHNNWILFFDEADAIFGKRTERNNSNDREVNQQIAYLFQRLEDYPGVIIFASNLNSNMDESFSRRFQSIIHFRMPAQEERYRLWINGFSKSIPPSQDIDLNELAEKYEFSGGTIMGIILSATLLAADRKNNEISRDNLLTAIKKNIRKDNLTI